MSGDKNFENYMDENDPQKEFSEKNNLPFFLVFSLREKYKSINDQYKITIDAIIKLTEQEQKQKKAPLTQELHNYVLRLIESSKETLLQFDYLIADSLGENKDDEDEEDEENEGLGEDNEP